MESESHESTTAYGLEFLEAIRRTADKRYVNVGPITDPIVPSLLEVLVYCSSDAHPDNALDLPTPS